MSTLSVRGRVAALACAGLLLAPAFATAEARRDQAGRAYLGVAASPAEEGQTGVMVRDVDPDSPAGKAGLRGGDRIVSAGDRPVQSFQDLRDAVAGHKPGDKLPLKVMREGKEETLNVTLGSEPARETRSFEAPDQGQRGGAAYLGVFTQPLNPDLREHLNVKADKGAFVARVLPGSPAAKAGLTEQDVITRFNDTPVNGPQDLRQAVEKAGVGKDVTLKVMRGDKEMDLKTKLAAEPAGREGFPQIPPGFGRFQDQMPPMFPGQQRMSDLEKKIQSLENRVNELEKNQRPNK
jgi:serine protease Do